MQTVKLLAEKINEAQLGGKCTLSTAGPLVEKSSITQQNQIKLLEEKLAELRNLNRVARTDPIYRASQTFHRAKFNPEDIQNSNIRSDFHFWSMGDQPMGENEEIPFQITRMALEIWKYIQTILRYEGNILSLSSFLSILAHFVKIGLIEWFEEVVQIGPEVVI